MSFASSEPEGRGAAASVLGQGTLRCVSGGEQGQDGVGGRQVAGGLRTVGGGAGIPGDTVRMRLGVFWQPPDGGPYSAEVGEQGVHLSTAQPLW